MRKKKLTVTVDEDVYEGLDAVVGRRNTSRFISDLARSHAVASTLDEGYRAMAADEEREVEALGWSEGLMIGDVADEPR